jgi:hypothetical protein
VPDSLLEKFNGDARHDYDLLMHFFCHEWNGRGCRVSLMPENYEVAKVFSSVGFSASPSEVEVAMRLFGVGDTEDCWERFNILAGEYRKK